MNETVPKKDNWFVAFWKTVWAVSFGKIDPSKARKINAAFGTMLMGILIGFGVPLAEFLFAVMSNTWAVYLVGAWEAFAIFFGVFIIIIFGTTQTSSSTTVNMTGKQIEDMVKTALSAALDAFILANTQTITTNDNETKPNDEGG